MGELSKNEKDLRELITAIALKHNCKAVYKETVLVHLSTADEETVWFGHVQVFDLIGHKRAKVCYAWRHHGPDGGMKPITVLGSRLVNSAQKAVQAAIFVDADNVVYFRDIAPS